MVVSWQQLPESRSVYDLYNCVNFLVFRMTALEPYTLSVIVRICYLYLFINHMYQHYRGCL